MQDIKNIDNLVASGRFDEAIGMLSLGIAGKEGMADAKALAEMYFRRGKLYWRLGRRSAATSDYVKASSLDADSPAVKALEQARDVEAFFNPDLYNP